MRKNKYRVYYGNTVPFSNKSFTTWKDASAFIVRCMNEGIRVNSVTPITEDDE